MYGALRTLPAIHMSSHLPRQAISGNGLIYHPRFQKKKSKTKTKTPQSITDNYDITCIKGTYILISQILRCSLKDEGKSGRGVDK